MKSACLIAVFLNLPVILPAQNVQDIDSLKKRIVSVSNDTIKAQLLYELSKEYWDRDLDSVNIISHELLKLSESIGYAKGIGNAYNSMGVAFWFKGDYPRALQQHMIALEKRQAAGDKQDIANSYNNIGLIYDDQGNFPLALEYYLKSLRVNEELGNKDGISQAYNNIGIIHYNQKHYEEALNDFNKSLQMRLSLNDKYALTESYSNIGLVLFEMKNYVEAMKNYEQAMKLRKEIDDREGIAISYANFGDYYYETGNYDEALKNYNLGLEINRDLGYKKKEANLYLSMSDVYEKLGNNNEALRVQLQALNILHEIGANDYIEKAYNKLSKSYAVKGDYRQAYNYHLLYKQANDSLFNTENVRALTRLQLQYDFDKKEAVAQAEQAKKDALTVAEIRRQKIIRYSVTGGLIGAFLFLLIVFRQRNKIAKEKKRSEKLLLNILPAETAEELKSTGSVTAKTINGVTVMFTDFKNFTSVSEKLTAQELVKQINFCYIEFDKIIARHGIEKIKTIGDSYMCACGLPIPNEAHAEVMVKAAKEIRDFMLLEKQKNEDAGRKFFEIRIGIHSGCVVAGVVGLNKFAYDIWGDTVNIAARMESSGDTGKINISAATYLLIKDKFSFTPRGKIMAKNKGEIEMFFVD